MSAEWACALPAPVRRVWRWTTIVVVVVFLSDGMTEANWFLDDMDEKDYM